MAIYRWVEFKNEKTSQTIGCTAFIPFEQFPLKDEMSREDHVERANKIGEACKAVAQEWIKIKHPEPDWKFVEAYSLPYPASPYAGNSEGWPAFCYSPETCKGRGSCPKNYACSE